MRDFILPAGWGLIKPVSAVLRGIGLLIAFAASFALLLVSLSWLSSRYFQIWMPVSLSVCVFLLLGAIPKASVWEIRIPFALTYLGLVLWCWNATRVPYPWERWDPGSHWLPYVALAIAGVGSLAWIVRTFQTQCGWVSTWLAIFLLLSALAALTSSQAGGPGSMTRWFMEHLQLTQEQAFQLTVITRKCLHFLFYGLVGLALVRAGKRGGAQQRVAVLVSLAGSTSLAAFDEYRQYLEPTRTGSALDVVLDLTGAVVFSLLGSRGK